MSWLVSLGRTARWQFLYGVILGAMFTSSLVSYYQSRRRRLLDIQSDSDVIQLRDEGVTSGLEGLIGNTPLVRITSLSNTMGVEILGKAEFLNPGGSIKDRVALRMIEDAERLGLLHPHTGSRIFEGTVGSTGISLTTVARARGYHTTIVMPDDVAEEKERVLRTLGADIVRVQPASIVDKNQYVNLARQYAIDFNHNHASREHTSEHISRTPRGFFADQFENRSNFDTHFSGTGPEIWRQTSGRLHAFVSGAGTGGTIAGVGRYIKSIDESVIITLADPEGSGLYNKVKHGVMYDQKESEGTKRRHQVDTVVEGIGINRLTNNISLALPIIDDAFRVTDAEAVSMSRYLVQNDGLFLGSSSACNLVACVKLAKKMGWKDGQTIVTILCDSGSRHHSKFWNDDYLREAHIPVDAEIVVDLLKS